MGPESIFVFSLSVLVVRGNPVSYLNSLLARRNFHDEVKSIQPYAKLHNTNENAPYQFRRMLQEETDPKIATIASAAADASMDVTKLLAKQISDAIALAVANAVAKALAQDTTTSKIETVKLTKDLPDGSDEVIYDSDVKPKSRHSNIEYRTFSNQRTPDVAYDTDTEFWPADKTNKYSKLSNADQKKIERKAYGDDGTESPNRDARPNPNVEYRRDGVIILHHNTTEPAHRHSRNMDHHNYQSNDEQQSVDDNNDTLKRYSKRRGRGRYHRLKKSYYTDVQV